MRLAVVTTVLPIFQKSSTIASNYFTTPAVARGQKAGSPVPAEIAAVTDIAVGRTRREELNGIERPLLILERMDQAGDHCIP